MSNPTIISIEDIKDFIFKQSDDRPLNMTENKSYNDCGCIMVHYGKDILNIKEPFSCGAARIGENFHIYGGLCKLHWTVANWFVNYEASPKTYGELKKFLNEN